MNRVLSQILEDRTVTDRSGKVRPLDSAIDHEEGEYLQSLIRQYQPKTTLEIGMAYGVSALYICEALSEVGGERHIAIDPNQDEQWGGTAVENVARAGYGRLLELVQEKSYLALPGLVAAGRKIDFAFIDGWHTFDYTFVDFFYLDLMLNVGGVIVFDDANWPAIRKVVRYVATNREYDVLPGMNAPSGWLGKAVTAFSRSPVARSFVREDILQPDSDLGVQSRFVGFRKREDDVHTWTYHKPF